MQIDFVESWKKYNIDTSCDNEFIKEKNKLIDLKRKALKGNIIKHDECTCNIYWYYKYVNDWDENFIIIII